MGVMKHGARVVGERVQAWRCVGTKGGQGWDMYIILSCMYHKSVRSSCQDLLIPVQRDFFVGISVVIRKSFIHEINLHTPRITSRY